MWEIFNPILAWLRDLLDNRLTTARAAKLDNLDAAVSTRAAADTAVSNANYTATRAGYLDHLNMAAGKITAAEDSPLLDVPIAGGIVGSAARVGGNVSSTPGVTTTTISSTSFTTVDSYTGAGVLNICVLQKTDAGANTCTLKVTLDGVVVVNQATGTNQYTAVAAAGLVAAGNLVMDQIPFKSSLLIEAKADASGATANCQVRYRKTA